MRVYAHTTRGSRGGFTSLQTSYLSNIDSYTLGNFFYLRHITATYLIDANELSTGLLNSIKEAFKNKAIETTVTEAIDETDYLLSPEANKAMLFESIKQLKEGKGIVFSIEQLREKYPE